LGEADTTTKEICRYPWRFRATKYPEDRQTPDHPRL
jgi:hypothetical protein